MKPRSLLPNVKITDFPGQRYMYSGETATVTLKRYNDIDCIIAYKKRERSVLLIIKGKQRYFQLRYSFEFKWISRELIRGINNYKILDKKEFAKLKKELIVNNLK